MYYFWLHIKECVIFYAYWLYYIQSLAGKQYAQSLDTTDSENLMFASSQPAPVILPSIPDVLLSLIEKKNRKSFTQPTNNDNMILNAFLNMTVDVTVAPMQFVSILLKYADLLIIVLYYHSSLSL